MTPTRRTHEPRPIAPISQPRPVCKGVGIDSTPQTPGVAKRPLVTQTWGYSPLLLSCPPTTQSAREGLQASDPQGWGWSMILSPYSKFVSCLPSDWAVTGSSQPLITKAAPPFSHLQEMGRMEWAWWGGAEGAPTPLHSG